MPVAGEYPLFVFFVFLTQPHTRTGERKTGEEEGPVAASLQSRMEHPVSKAKDETREIIRKKGEYVYIYSSIGYAIVSKSNSSLLQLLNDGK